MNKTNIELSVWKCSAHNFVCVDIGQKDESSLRITPSKCCGSWNTKLHSFRMSEYDLGRAADEFRKLARKLRNEAKAAT